jgi:hypothetical protein
MHFHSSTSDNMLMPEPGFRIQFRVRHLLLLTFAAGTLLGVVRWIVTRKLPSEDYAPQIVWAAITLAQLTAMGWMLLSARRSFEISWVRAVSVLLGTGPVICWIGCLASIGTPRSAGDAPLIVQLAVTTGVCAALFSFPLVLLAIAANLWRMTDRPLLAMQLGALVSSVFSFDLGFPRSLLW